MENKLMVRQPRLEFPGACRVCRRRWGRVFGGCYKSIVAQGVDHHGMMVDHVHLNPVRARLDHASPTLLRGRETR